VGRCLGRFALLAVWGLGTTAFASLVVARGLEGRATVRGTGRSLVRARVRAASLATKVNLRSWAASHFLLLLPE
jgi:hypothetical protein